LTVLFNLYPFAVISLLYRRSINILHKRLVSITAFKDIVIGSRDCIVSVNWFQRAVAKVLDEPYSQLTPLSR
jgi:hypothetical protein